MLTAIEVENFKGIGRPVRIELRPITLLFGPNSAGKSTILHALHYAHEILSRRNFDPDRTHHGGDIVDLGGFRTFVHGHDLDRSIRLRLEFELRGRDLPELMKPFFTEETMGIEFFNEGLERLLETGWVELKVQWSEGESRPSLVQAAYARLPARQRELRSHGTGRAHVGRGRWESTPDCRHMAAEAPTSSC